MYRLFVTIYFLKVRQIFFQCHYRFKDICKINNVVYCKKIDHFKKIVSPNSKNQFISTTKISVLGQLTDWSDIDDILTLDLLRRFEFYYSEYLLDFSVSSSVRLAFFSKLHKLSPKDSAYFHPYVVSRRILNLCKFLCVELNQNRHDFLVDCLMSDFSHLQHNLEFHIDGNHLLSNRLSLLLYAIVVRDADKFRHFEKEFFKELDCQILNDGSHYELSPMYQSIIIQDILDLANLAKAYNKNELFSRLEIVLKPMLRWLEPFAINDSYANFNDVFLENSVNFNSLIDYYESVFCQKYVLNRMPQIWFPESGYWISKFDDIQLIFDAGQPAASHVTGHAHADIGSFELILGDRYLFRNTGTSTYAVSKRRLEERASKSHNTFHLGAESSSNVWSAFRTAERVHILCAAPSGSQLKKFHLEYEGYFGSWSRLVHHSRDVEHDENKITFRDSITYLKNSKQLGALSFILDEGWMVEPIGQEALLIRSGTTLCMFKTTGRIELQNTEIALSYGVTTPSHVIRVLPTSGTVVTEITIGT